ncbi:MAG TPA: hypothetical protein ENK23_05820, partial [Sorangium sp.]|nr:hypothetical protein [Sorangium sp.]
MEAIDHARQVLPAWVGWLGPGGYLVATSVLGWLCLRLTGMQLLQPLKRARQRALVERRRVHWSETARLGFAARRGYLMMSVLLMVIFGAAAAFWCGPLARLSWGAVAALVVLSQLLLAVVGYRKQVMTVVMEVLPPWRDSLAGVAIQALLLRPAMFVVLAAMWLA